MRFQLALNVKDLDEAVDYYTRLFGVEVNKRKPGYANLSVQHPPLKLVLVEDPNATERLNHVGFETFDNDEVEDMIGRLEPAGLTTYIDREEHCCYAMKSSVWAQDPQGLNWEFYKVNEDTEDFGESTTEQIDRAVEEKEKAQACCPSAASA